MDIHIYHHNIDNYFLPLQDYLYPGGGIAPPPRGTPTIQSPYINTVTPYGQYIPKTGTGKTISNNSNESLKYVSSQPTGTQSSEMED